MEQARELELDHAFWGAISNNREMQSWLLARTKFSARSLELVADEKWHQRWYRDPESGKDSETDILLMWREAATGERFATHIENKPPHRSWEPGQAENYRRRADQRKAAWKYADYEVLLLAPISFIAKHADEAAHFDFVVTYEEVGQYVPEFATAAALSKPPTLMDSLRAELLRRPADPVALNAQPWLAEVRRGRFHAIPEGLAWSKSAALAHLINGYDLFGDTLSQLANHRLEQAKRSGGWEGDPLELWACLFGEHRRARHGGFGPEADSSLHDDLCRALRASLVGQRS